MWMVIWTDSLSPDRIKLQNGFSSASSTKCMRRRLVMWSWIGLLIRFQFELFASKLFFFCFKYWDVSAGISSPRRIWTDTIHDAEKMIELVKSRIWLIHLIENVEAGAIIWRSLILNNNNKIQYQPKGVETWYSTFQLYRINHNYFHYRGEAISSIDVSNRRSTIWQLRIKEKSKAVSQNVSKPNHLHLSGHAVGSYGLW